MTLSASVDPVLAELWHNERDAAYDDFMITRKLGTMSRNDLKEVDKQLSIALGLGDRIDKGL